MSKQGLTLRLFVTCGTIRAAQNFAKLCNTIIAGEGELGNLIICSYVEPLVENIINTSSQHGGMNPTKIAPQNFARFCKHELKKFDYTHAGRWDKRLKAHEVA